ncbi:dicarboxylate/amino acid:cation symporter [Anabaena sp. PCC 7108]|uniref:dicarboxylate/amino acid:cation symporter n=1 Tax=Anabaena sp. PCC 7108 TaxID=163908 RepID=UPI00034CD06C|nr:dicarboxylate/amino acid:cation symporter [Anabaena sp. PCC 7108]
MSETENTNSPGTKNLSWWQRIPLTLQIIIALVLAIILGIALGAGNPSPSNAIFITNLAIPAELILKALRALATPLILVAVLHTFMTTNIPGTAGRKLAVLLLTNTTVAIVIGLLVANILRPGTWGTLVDPGSTQITPQSFDPWGLFKDAVPDAILKPLVDNNVIQLIIIALSFGIVLRGLKSEQINQGKKEYQSIENVIATLFEAIIRILNWVIALVPLAVFGIVAKIIAERGFAPFQSLAAFIIAVLVALFLQACYYLTRVKLGSWVNPIKFLAGGADAFLTAFSTSSSTVAMPITFEVLQTKIGLRESSASLGALVGANFNNDGTALYEAMSALYISQVIGQHLSLGQQLIVVLTSIFASVGAAGIPNAGLVTMTLVFSSVGLPTDYIALLVTVDWFLDRCRTAINVMGDMTVSALLDGKKPRSIDDEA